MSKTFKTILILSIAANAVWLLAAATGYFSFCKPSDANTPVPASASTLSPEAAKEIAALISTNDLAALRDQLRKLGLQDDLTRAIVEERIYAVGRARLQGIFNEVLERARQRPYWRADSTSAYGALNYLTFEQLKEYNDINRDAQRQLRQLFGDDAESAYSRRAYPFLSADKVGQLQDLDSDYSALQMQSLQEMNSFLMPDDMAKTKLLAEEKQRDMDALLTPEEKMENDLRNSSTANSLKHRLAGIDITEDEYKTLYALQSAVSEKYDANETNMMILGNAVASVSESYAARVEAQKEVDAQIKAVLGDDRYADYLRDQRSDYRSLQAAAQRFNLAPETVSQTYQVREDTVSEASRISKDKTLSAEEKTQAYAALAEQATAQIRANLGDEVGDAYINNALGWLKKLPQGGAVSITPNGTVNVTPPKPDSK